MRFLASRVEQRVSRLRRYAPRPSWLMRQSVVEKGLGGDEPVIQPRGGRPAGAVYQGRRVGSIGTLRPLGRAPVAVLSSRSHGPDLDRHLYVRLGVGRRDHLGIDALLETHRPHASPAQLHTVT